MMTDGSIANQSDRLRNHVERYVADLPGLLVTDLLIAAAEMDRMRAEVQYSRELWQRVAAAVRSMERDPNRDAFTFVFTGMDIVSLGFWEALPVVPS